jgi:hypothetical protein
MTTGSCSGVFIGYQNRDFGAVCPDGEYGSALRISPIRLPDSMKAVVIHVFSYRYAGSCVFVESHDS